MEHIPPCCETIEIDGDTSANINFSMLGREYHWQMFQTGPGSAPDFCFDVDEHQFDPQPKDLPTLTSFLQPDHADPPKEKIIYELIQAYADYRRSLLQHHDDATIRRFWSDCHNQDGLEAVCHLPIRAAPDIPVTQYGDASFKYHFRGLHSTVSRTSELLETSPPYLLITITPGSRVAITKLIFPPQLNLKYQPRYDIVMPLPNFIREVTKELQNKIDKRDKQGSVVQNFGPAFIEKFKSCLLEYDEDKKIYRVLFADFIKSSIVTVSLGPRFPEVAPTVTIQEISQHQTQPRPRQLHVPHSPRWSAEEMVNRIMQLIQDPSSQSSYSGASYGSTHSSSSSSSSLYNTGSQYQTLNTYASTSSARPSYTQPSHNTYASTSSARPGYTQPSSNISSTNTLRNPSKNSSRSTSPGRQSQQTSYKTQTSTSSNKSLTKPERAPPSTPSRSFTDIGRTPTTNSSTLRSRTDTGLLTSEHGSSTSSVSRSNSGGSQSSVNTITRVPRNDSDTNDTKESGMIRSKPTTYQGDVKELYE